MNYMEVMELFNSLESNLPQEVEEVKHKFHEQFNNTRDSWLLNGMYDYFMSTGSQRAVEVLVAVREPHDKFLFDKLGEGLRSANRLQALTLLGHVVKRQPTWLIKITNHYLLKELLKLLKSENEIITITSALLVLNVLLTVIPALISSFLPDIFEGFSRLAAWNTSQKNRVPEIHLFHLQISLYVLFVQLYSMYPCSFILYLKQQYGKTDNHLVFTHTIKPMVETMRMHPSLIVSSKDDETSTRRWKKMEQHDVVMECTRYTLLENGERNYQNPTTLTNAGSSFSSALEALKSTIGATGDIISVNSIRNKELWSPMLYCGEFSKDTVKSIPTTPNIQSFYKASIFNHNEHSPPEAAVEATPETTPIRDVIYQQPRLPSINSTVVRALNSFGLENLSRRNSSTPNSQPSSPLKKEGFVFPSEDIQSQALVRRMDRMILERNQISESIKDIESSYRSETKPIAAQIQPTINPDIIQTGEEDIEECDQQSNGSPCQTYEGGLHMPDSTSLKEFVISVRTRKRFYSQCTPEKTIHITGQSTGSSPKKGLEFSSLSVRRAKSCPEIKKKNGSSISSGTSPLQEETEDDHGDNINVSNGHTSELPTNDFKKENLATKVRTVFTQTEHILPYEHLFYSIFPAYNDPNNSVKGQQNFNTQEDESLNLIEKYVRTSAIVLNHRHTAKSSDDVKLLQDQIALLTLQLQFERNRREVHAERNRRLLGKSRSSRALDEHNSALKDQVSMLQIELEQVTSGFEQSRQESSKQIKDLKDSVSHWQTECLKYQEETKEAKNNYVSLEQLYNGERIKTAEVTKQLSETKAELFNTLSELSIVQAAADISKELKNTVTNLQRELVISGEMQSRQRDIMTHVNALRYDAAYAMLSQESYKNNLNVLQDSLHLKSALLDASNARIADLEQKLNTQNVCVQNEKSDRELLKEQFNKQLSELKEECRILKEIKCQYEESKEEEESKQRFETFLKELPKFSSDVTMVDSQSSITDQDAKFRLSMLLADKDESCDVVPDVPTTPK